MAEEEEVSKGLECTKGVQETAASWGRRAWGDIVEAVLPWVELVLNVNAHVFEVMIQTQRTAAGCGCKRNITPRPRLGPLHLVQRAGINSTLGTHSIPWPQYHVLWISLYRRGNYTIVRANTAQGRQRLFKRRKQTKEATALYKLILQLVHPVRHSSVST